jgi:hypothetical protein
MSLNQFVPTKAEADLWLHLANQISAGCQLPYVFGSWAR